MVSVAVGISDCGWASGIIVVLTSGFMAGSRSVNHGTLPALMAGSSVLCDGTHESQLLKLHILEELASTLTDPARGYILLAVMMYPRGRPFTNAQ